ncbi:hypothetical protein [Leptonema illini]|uniref:Lipoprotein n=1 Tax=Leptonema illini DSM 21528 TaxID=929563 RepID=H2CF15_9LEPT|nr:hypothetical protein [Leptonema illini]EHQ05618.1 hypothetical protein Lepil_0917 [Leptonema illini DSM 21528]
MKKKDTRMLSRGLPFRRAIIAIALIAVLLSCTNAKDEGELTVLGPDGGYTYFKGDLNMNLMSNCGTATAQTTTGGGSGSSTTKNLWDVESYFIFTYGEFIFTRFTYSKLKNSYSLTPSTTSTSTCNTIDGIYCNSSGTLTCETADNVRCGGTKSFIFSGGLPATVFQAVTGTIDYQMSVDENNNTVRSADLEFEMIDSQGRILQGEVHCYAP